MKILILNEELEQVITPLISEGNGIFIADNIPLGRYTWKISDDCYDIQTGVVDVFENGVEVEIPVQMNFDAIRHVKKYFTTIGDGINTTFLINHNFDTKDVDVTVFDNNTGETVFAESTRTSVNTITLDFVVAPAIDQFRVIVRG